MRRLPNRTDVDQLHRQATERVRRGPSPHPAVATRTWTAMVDDIVRQLERQTGHSVEEWRRRLVKEGHADEAGLRRWLTKKNVTGYPQMLLVWERFGYPHYMNASADELIDGQYADRPALRAILDAILTALPDVGQVTLQARKTYISLVSPRRTFAVVQATTKTRVDLGLRLANAKPTGRLVAAKGIGNGATTMRVGLSSAGDVDAEVLRLLKRAYQENA